MSKVRRISPSDAKIRNVLALVRDAFAGMDARIDPPSSMNTLTEDSIAQQCEDGEVWVCGDPPLACVFFSQKGDRLYLGKLAVADHARGAGVARQLVRLAETRAQQLGLTTLEINTRVELTDNQEVFRRLGFVQTGVGSHRGYTRPTFVIMQKPVSASRKATT